MKSKFLLTTLALAFAAAPAFAATAAAPEPAAERQGVVNALNEKIAAEAQAKDMAANAAREVTKAKAEADVARAQAAKVRTEMAAKIPSEPVTFLGVMTAPAPSALTSQLGRPAGMGLIVVSVQTKSPAEDVLKVDDLLVRLDDQKLINNDQLTALIRSHQEGDEVSVTYVRAAKEATAKVKLTKQTVAPRMPAIATLTNVAGTPSPAMDMALEQYMRPPQVIVRASGNSDSSSLSTTSSTENDGSTKQAFTYTDAGGRIEINVTDGKKKVTVREPDGTVSFTGPYDTEAERKAASASVQARVAAVEDKISSTRVGVRVGDGRAGARTLVVRPVEGNRVEVPLPVEKAGTH